MTRGKICKWHEYSVTINGNSRTQARYGWAVLWKEKKAESRTKGESYISIYYSASKCASSYKNKLLTHMWCACAWCYAVLKFSTSRWYLERTRPIKISTWLFLFILHPFVNFHNHVAVESKPNENLPNHRYLVARFTRGKLACLPIRVTLEITYVQHV